MVGKGMLGLPPMSWKAVGLTSKLARWALTQNSRQCQAGRGERVPARARAKGQYRGGDNRRNPTIPYSRSSENRETTAAQEESPGKPRDAPVWPHPGKGETKLSAKTSYQAGKAKSMCGTGNSGWHNCPGRSGSGHPVDNGGVDARKPGVRLEDLLGEEGLAGHLAVLAAGEGEKKTTGPPVKGEKATSPPQGGQDGDGEGRRQDKHPEEENTGERKTTGDVIRLDYAPVCCSCGRQGADALKHPGEVFVTSTFALRPLRRGSTTNLGICLVESRAGSVTSPRGRLCGHIVCPGCTASRRDRLMCACCATRLDSQGAAKGGAGPLPPKARDPTPTPEASPSPEPRRERSQDSREDSDRRSRREETSPGRRPLPGPPYPGQGRNPPYEYGNEETRRPAKRARYEACVIKGCEREARGDRNTCCEVCARTGGQRHSGYCDSRHGLEPPPKNRDDEDYRDDDDDEDDEDKGRGKKGKGKQGKGRWKWVSKRQGKEIRDRERWNAWNKSGRRKKSAWNVTLFKAALKMGQAPNTRRSVESRLLTWDRAMEELEKKEILGESKHRTLMSPCRVKAGVAYLKAQGYRSAELYMSAALKRHRVMFGQDPQLTEAAREATRLARRGRGPPAGKQPVPVPVPESPLFEAIITGIWFLLRADELVNLNVGDAWRKQGGQSVQVALVIRQSKTDQEGQGELVTRNCACTESPNDRCPAHVVWDQVTDRLIAGRKLGADMSQAPLFVGSSGNRLSKSEVVEAVKAIAMAAGEPLRTNGQNRYGTHSMRVAGALLAFSANVGEETVRALGRWKTTQAMMAYLRGTPVIKAASATAPMAQVMEEGGQLGSENFRPIMRDGLGQKGDAVEMPEAGQMLLRHGLTGILHRPGKMEGPAEHWTAWCGWKWAKCGTAGAFCPTTEAEVCRRCFASEKLQASRCSTRKDECD